MLRRTGRGGQARLALCVLLWCGGVRAAAAAPEAAKPAADAAGAAGAGVSAADELVRRIDAAQKGMRTLSADFVQRSRVKLFKQEVRSDGRLLYRAAAAGAPASLRWEYVKPDPSTLLLIGDVATLRMGNLPPRVFDAGKDANMRAIFGQLRLWLGQGTLADAQAEYALSSAGTAAHPALVLVPKPSSLLSKHFTRIEMHCDGRTLQLERLVLTEITGDEKEIAFSAVRRDAPLPADAFK